MFGEKGLTICPKFAQSRIRGQIFLPIFFKFYSNFDFFTFLFFGLELRDRANHSPRPCYNASAVPPIVDIKVHFGWWKILVNPWAPGDSAGSWWNFSPNGWRAAMQAADLFLTST